jgi:CBS domain-containing protein
VDSSAGKRLPRDAALGRPVRDVMRLDPKTLAADATVAEARAFFGGSSARLALLVDGRAFVAALTRGDIPDGVEDEAAAAEFGQTDVEWVGPDVLTDEIVDALEAAPERRIVVLDGNRTLAGLLCLNRSGTEFCR